MWWSLNVVLDRCWPEVKIHMHLGLGSEFKPQVPGTSLQYRLFILNDQVDTYLPLLLDNLAPLFSLSYLKSES
jgi:hypothetical protein